MVGRTVMRREEREKEKEEGDGEEKKGVFRVIMTSTLLMAVSRSILSLLCHLTNL